jgi:hypothetical protein
LQSSVEPSRPPGVYVGAEFHGDFSPGLQL